MRKAIPFALPVVLLTAATTLIGLTRRPAALAADAPREIAFVSLEGSVQPLKKAFNKHKSRPRILVLVSATCPACIHGTRAVQEAIVEPTPPIGAEIFVVWLDVLPFDGKKTAAKTAQILSPDPRIHHFHDPDRLVGKAVARSLQWDEGFAWDIYLLYQTGTQWKELPPAPQGYVHQLSRRSEDGHFCSGESLVPDLKNLVAPLANTKEAAGRALDSQKPRD